MGALARRAAAGMETRASERGVTFDCHGDDDLIVLVDARRAVQVLTNLLGNAVTHMDAPGPVHITWERRGREALVQIVDRGAGIPAADLPRIFERFYRVDISRSRATGGAGLGLSIVHQLVTAHGGRVWAQSEEGQGSTFFFTLPLA
jgi:signal transduction histidine kinase